MSIDSTPIYSRSSGAVGKLTYSRGPISSVHDNPVTMYPASSELRLASSFVVSSLFARGCSLDYAPRPGLTHRWHVHA